MAKSFVSPGVFTNEVDASFLAPGVGAIGAALIGTAPQGPAFLPVTVTDYSQFVSIFGDLDPDHKLGYAAKAYLKNSATANIVRVLGPAGRSVNGSVVNPGYTAESIWAITAFTGSNVGGVGATGSIMALLEITASHSLIINDLTNDNFDLRITGTPSTLDVYVTASMVSGSSNYIAKVLNTDPTQFATYGYYVRQIYENALYGVSTPSTPGYATYKSASFSTMTDFGFGYNSGSSPWIKSQVFGGATEYNLFRVHTLGHGEIEASRLKISVKNVRTSAAPSVDPWGKFDLEVRAFGDTDASPNVLEKFPNLSLNPASPEYILKVIGDKLITYDISRDKMVETGNYPNKSKLIRIEVPTTSFPESALPWGFRGLAKPDLTIKADNFGTASSGLVSIPYVGSLFGKRSDGTLDGEVSSKVYWGMETQLSGNVKARLVKMSTMTGSDADFSLKYVSGSSETATHEGVGALGLSYRKDLFDDSRMTSAHYKSPGSSTSATTLSPAMAKFTVPVAFGYDGFDRRVSAPLDNEARLATISQIGTQALRQAIDTIKDSDFIDINMLVIPGVYSTKVTDYATTQIEARADAFYVMDISGSTTTDVIQNIKNRSLDTNYVGCYYPDINVYDNVNGQIVRLPSSVAAAAAIAYNDRIAYPWYAPAGLNRAGLNTDVLGFQVTSLVDQLKSSERDDLYEARINPIARFTDTPAVIWGQKTLQLKSSALDRINVRRLMIRAKKLVASAVKYLVFEANNAATQTKFKQLVNPILADIQSKNGLEQFKVVMDSTTNTPDLIDRNIMYGKIFLVPTRTAEFISVDFIISPTGTTFEE